MAKLSLRDILKDYKDTKMLAETDISAIPWKSKTAIETAVNESKGRVRELALQFEATVANKLLGVNPRGDVAAVGEFIEVGRTVTVDANEFYVELARPVEATLGSTRAYHPDSQMRLISALKEFSTPLEIHSIPALNPVFGTVLEDFNATLTFVKALFRGSMGDELNVIYLRKAITRQVLDRELIDDIVPVIVTNVDTETQDELSKLFPLGFTSVKITSPITDKDVAKAFKLATRK